MEGSDRGEHPRLMQPITSFNDNLGSCILLLGPPGGGKTVLGCRLFPDTYVCISDLNFSSAKKYLEKTGQLDNVVGIDVIGSDEKSETVPLQARYPKLIAAVNEAEKDPKVGTIFHDSITFHASIFMGKLTMAAKIAD